MDGMDGVTLSDKLGIQARRYISRYIRGVSDTIIVVRGIPPGLVWGRILTSHKYIDRDDLMASLFWAADSL